MIFGRQALINIKVFVMTRTKENRRNIEVYFGCSFTYFESFWHLFDTFIDLFLSIYIHYYLMCSAYQPNSFPLTFLYIFFIILPKQSLTLLWSIRTTTAWMFFSHVFIMQNWNWYYDVGGGMETKVAKKYVKASAQVK